MTIQEIKSEIQKYEYVSFDIFDTLIYRSVYKPNDIFKMVEEVYRLQFRKNISSFYINRVYSAAKAKEYYKKEVTIDEIYQFMPYKQTEVEILKQIEIDCEIDTCMPNLLMCDLLNWCTSNGKFVVITSDMYLPSHVLEKILVKIGVNYNKLYVSCEVGDTKRSGLLFDYILKDLGISAKQLCHIGDDENNDIFQAEKKGIKPYYTVSSVKDHISCYSNKYRRSITIDKITRMYQHKYYDCKCKSPEYRIGYNVLGPFLFCFCLWINKLKKDEKINGLYFLSREGYLIQKIYNIMYPENEGCSKYFRLNANLLRLPSLSYNPKPEIFARTIPGGMKIISWKTLLLLFQVQNIGSVITLLKNKFQNIDFTRDIRKSDIDKGYFDNVINEILLIQNKDINKQRQLLLEYLKNNNITVGKNAIINNSMKGTSQTLFDDFCRENNINANVIGLQFSSAYKNIKDSSIPIRVFFRDIGETFTNEKMFEGECLLFEHLLFEPNGTSRLFYKDDNGNVNVKCDEPIYEKQNYNTISKIHNAAIDFVRDFAVKIHYFENRDLLKPMFKMLNSPEREDAAIINGLIDEDLDKAMPFNDMKNVNRISFLYRNKNNERMWIPGLLVFKRTGKFELKMYYYRRLFVTIIKNKIFLKHLSVLMIRQYGYLLNALLNKTNIIYSKIYNMFSYRYFIFKINYDSRTSSNTDFKQI